MASAVEFKAIFREFDDVSDSVIDYWLSRSAMIVDDRFTDKDTPSYYFTAHHLALSGAGGIPAGVTGFKSGSVDIQFSSVAADLAARGGYMATRYGVEFLSFLRGVTAGPRLVA
jgi:Protein of unknown function (DUF4054)